MNLDKTTHIRYKRLLYRQFDLFSGKIALQINNAKVA